MSVKENPRITGICDINPRHFVTMPAQLHLNSTISHHCTANLVSRVLQRRHGQAATMSVKQKKTSSFWSNPEKFQKKLLLTAKIGVEGSNHVHYPGISLAKRCSSGREDVNDDQRLWTSINCNGKRMLIFFFDHQAIVNHEIVS